MVVIVMVCSRLAPLSGEEDDRNMYKVGGVAGVSGALGRLSASFLTGSSDDKPSTALSVDELSLYTTPQEGFRYVEPERGQVEERVAALRKLAEPYSTLCQQTAGSARQKVQGVYGAVKPRLDSTFQFGQINGGQELSGYKHSSKYLSLSDQNKDIYTDLEQLEDSYAYLKNPPPEFYPRAGVIGFAGIIGLFLGRGSRLKKLLYPSGLMAVAASLYYPQEAVTMAKGTGDTVYDWALQAFVAVEKLFKDKPRGQQKAGLAEKTSGGETKA